MRFLLNLKTYLKFVLNEKNVFELFHILVMAYVFFRFGFYLTETLIQMISNTLKIKSNILIICAANDGKM